MGTNSHIDWTDHTWNPWQGCTKISDGCKNCYMYRDKKRYGHDPTRVVRSAKNTFYAPLRKLWLPGSRIFVCSWSDFFHHAADPWRDEAWAIIRARRDVAFLLLTKRLERAPTCLPEDWGDGWLHVWLGVSVEDQEAADSRIPMLLHTPAALRFVSYEPALSIVDFGLWIEYLDWLICGGESGPKARPMHPDWARSARDQCAAAGVPFFLKQWGGSKPGGPALLDGCEHRAFPESRAVI